MLKRIFYWVLTALLAAWLVAGGIFDSTHAPAAMALLHKLGYPDYLASFLGACKLLAVPALLYPPARLLREWAYAGIAFDVLGACFSHLAVKDDLGATITPLVMLVLAIGSYLLRPPNYRSLPAEAFALRS